MESRGVVSDGSVGEELLLTSGIEGENAVLSSAYAVFDQVSDAIVLLDTEGQCIFLNSKAEYIFKVNGRTLHPEPALELFERGLGEFNITSVNRDGHEHELHIISSRITWCGEPAFLYTASIVEQSSKLASQLELNIERTATILDNVLSNIDEVIVTLSDDLVVVDITSSIFRITGYPVEHYIGTALSTAVFEEDRNALGALEAPADGELQLILRFYSFDRNGRWLRCRFYCEHVAGSRSAVSMRGVLRDITELKRFEDELTLTEVKYRTIFETSKTALILFNSDQTVSLVNAEAEQVTGYTASELTDGRKWSEHVAPHDRQRLIEYNRLRRKDPGNVPDVYEFQLVNKDGEYRDILIKIALIPGTEQGVASFIDITESKYRTTMYKTIIEQSLLGVMVVRDGRILFANAHATEITGYPVDELKNLPADGIFSIVRVEEKEKVITAMNSVLHGTSTKNRILLRIRRSDGTEGSIDCFFSAINYHGQKSVLILSLDVSGRIEMLEKLRESEERYKMFSEVISDYAYTKVLQPDGTWNTEWVSETIRKMVPDSEEQLHFDWSDYVEESDIRTLQTHQQNTLNGLSDKAEFKIRKPGGDLIWVREYCKPVHTSVTGNIEKIYAVGQDITERRTMRQALHEFERRFRVMLEHLSMISVILDIHGKLVFSNDYFLNLTGYTRDEVMSVNWFEVFIPEDIRDSVERMFKNTVPQGEFPVNYENEICTRNGSRRLISWTNTILHDTKGNIIGTASIGEDITDRRMAEKRLRESEEKYRQLFTIEPDALLVHDLKTRKVTEANDAALAMYGYTRDEITGLTIEELSAEPEQTIAAINQMPARNRLKIPLRYHKRKDGGVFAVEISAGLFYHDKLEYIYTSIRDISERVQSERALISAKQHAELGDKLKDAFIANMSHEIRTPLNIILGYTGIIENDLSGQLNEEQLDYFRSVERAGSRLQRTVEQLLNLSSLQVGTYSSNPVEFDLCENVDHLVYDMISLAHAKNIALEIVHEHSPLRVRADMYLVDQALANILDNAIKFTDNGGVFVRVQVQSDFASIEVRDTGIGISEEYLPHIFTMFSQEELGYTRPFDGLGIGLALTKMYMDEVGGEVRIASTKGEGTSVTLDVPMAFEPQRKKTVSGEAGREVSSVSRKQILLIEDDALTQKYLTIALQGKHQLIFAESTEDALKVLTSKPVDVIMLDLYMKGAYDGLHTAKTIKSINAFSHIPIVVVTAHEKPDDRARCTAAGCSEFLLKPLRRMELEETIIRVTDS